MKTLGEGELLKRSSPSPNPTPSQELSHHAPSNGGGRFMGKGRPWEGANFLKEVHPFPNPSPSRTFPPRSVQQKIRFWSARWTERGGNFFFGWVMIFGLDRFVSIISNKTNIVEPAEWRAAVPLPNLAVCSAKNSTSCPDNIFP